MPSNDTASLEYLAAFGEAWNSHDVDSVMACMTPDCVLHASVGSDVDGASVEGFEATRRAVAAFFETYPDAHFEPVDVFVAGDRGVSERVFTRTKPDGTNVHARSCEVFTFADGKIRIGNAIRKQRP